MEHNSSTVFSTPVILAQLGECGVHNLAVAHSHPNPTCYILRYESVMLVFLFPVTTLEDLGHNQGGTRSMIRATHSVGTHPGMPRMMMYAMLGNKEPTQQQDAFNDVDLLQ